MALVTHGSAAHASFGFPLLPPGHFEMRFSSGLLRRVLLGTAIGDLGCAHEHGHRAGLIDAGLLGVRARACSEARLESEREGCEVAASRAAQDDGRPTPITRRCSAVRRTGPITARERPVHNGQGGGPEPPWSVDLLRVRLLVPDELEPPRAPPALL